MTPLSHQEPDDNPEYDNPLGRLPNGGKLPTDDQPDDDYVDFLPHRDSDKRKSLEKTLIYLAMIEQRKKCMCEPAIQLDKFYTSLKAAGKRLDSARADLKKGNAKKQQSAEQHVENLVRLHDFYMDAIERWALDIVIAMNESLEALAVHAETEIPGIDGKDIAKELRREIYGAK